MNVAFPRIYKKNFQALGTEISLQLVVDGKQQEDLARKDAQDIASLYEKYSKIFSRFDQESELSFLNSNQGIFQSASKEMRKVIQACLDFHKKTQKYFDPRILEHLEANGYGQNFTDGVLQRQKQNLPLKFPALEKELIIENQQVFFARPMDFSGIAKGFITDQAVSFLLEKKQKNFLVDSGGDIFCAGADDEGKKWTVDVEGVDSKKIMFHLSDCAIATSGIGKRKWEIGGTRFHHLLNPKNIEEFSFDLSSVTVIANTTTEADIFAKTLFLMGMKNGTIWAREKEIAAIFLKYNGTSWISPKAKEYII